MENETKEVKVEDTSESSDKMGNKKIETSITNKTTFKEKVKQHWGRFKAFSKTRKGKIVIAVSCVIGLLVLVGVIFLVSSLLKKKPDVQIAENIASSKIYDNYDYIYNNEENNLIASTIDRSKQLEIISGDTKLVDYIVSPNKKKITYSVSDPDYKSKVKSPNIDLTKINFPPIAFKVYELNLETGDNTLIWETNEIQLKSTKEQLYDKKKVLFPDSYALAYNGSYVYSYPVSYYGDVDDIEKGYRIDYLPWDLSQELSTKIMRLISYSDNSEDILMTVGNNFLIYNIQTAQTASLPSPVALSSGGIDCSSSGDWEGDIFRFGMNCQQYYGGPNNIYKIDNNVIRTLNVNSPTTGGYYPIQITDKFTLITSYPGYTGGQSIKNTLDSVDVNTYKTTKIFEIENNTYAVNVESKDKNLIAIVSLKDNDHRLNRIYSLNEFDFTNSSLSEIIKVELPSDAQDLTYDQDANTISYYRRYQASNESIIEYKVVDLSNNEEDELLTIKVSNQSVLYYKPKLVWLDRE